MGRNKDSSESACERVCLSSRLRGRKEGAKCAIKFFFFEIKERVKNTRTNERKRVVSFIEKKKKKEESKFFTRTLSHKESLCLCVSVSLSRARVRERKRESNVGRRVRRRDRCVALFYRGGFPGEQSWFRKRLKVKS